MIRTVKICICLLLIVCTSAFGQIKKYNYKREIKGITDDWHKLDLPDELFSKVSSDLSDIRIYGLNASKDTVEAPYLINFKKDKVSSADIDFNILNTSRNGKGYYFTFEVPTKKTVNEIKLDFEQKNFDWRLKLEGSQDQEEWFTLLDDYRILSVNNALTNYQFSKISFPDSKYRFFRVLIRSKGKPDLKSAKVLQNKITEGISRTYPTKSLSISEDKKRKETVIDIETDLMVPVSSVKIGIKDSFEYYRPVTVKYLVDSIETEQGRKYIYKKLTSTTLNSIEENVIKFPVKIVKKLRITIHNGDNQALKIQGVEVNGYAYELLSRFSEPATYFLVYGNCKARKPMYDIQRFASNIPKLLPKVELGKEERIIKKKSQIKEPLFKNKIWLWAIMSVIIVLLGWFSVSMIRKK